ncbi:MAG TPA: N-acetylmuramoyl-L-alanine amidase [Sedimentisphaerales bacterium]|nr:N-acetylmuramoyl-L-alanine amidase [Sedimentisphaerales bacterium]HQG47780.1 N-acetylmuramoyl-L-alanine amidase [Sedimentisphaerales bacterium]
MANQPRVVKVLGALLVSMTVGAFVLMALGNNPPSAGPFCLSAYYRLTSVDQAVRSKACQTPNRWSSIEIFFSGTQGRNLSPVGATDTNCHFVICNGTGAGDGEIQATDQWQNQYSIQPSRTWQGSNTTIRICLIGDGIHTMPTDYQLKRLEMLLEALCRKFRIPASQVFLPTDCQ